MATGLKLPIVQNRLENDFPDSTVVGQLQALKRGDASDEEFALAQKQYLVFLTCQMLYDKYLLTQNGVRRKRHIMNLIQRNATAEGLTGSSNSSSQSAAQAAPTRQPQADMKGSVSTGQVPAPVGTDQLIDKTTPRKKK